MLSWPHRMLKRFWPGAVKPFGHSPRLVKKGKAPRPDRAFELLAALRSDIEVPASENLLSALRRGRQQRLDACQQVDGGYVPSIGAAAARKHDCVPGLQVAEGQRG